MAAFRLRFEWVLFLTMFQSSLRLRSHALVVSAALLALVALLGARAYSVARDHYAETSRLVYHDLRADELLVRMETAFKSEGLARRKFAVTQDPVYKSLLDRQELARRQAASDLREALEPQGKELAARATTLDSIASIEALRADLHSLREGGIKHAHDTARGLLHLIGFALLIAAAVTAWLLWLFYSGLAAPLRRIKEATSRIGSGDLACRIDDSTGVWELRELSRSFNRMAEKVESLDQTKTEFLATISHEIKNPLAALKEGLTLLVERGEDLTGPARARAFGASLIAAKRLESMINNLLSLSRLEAGLFRFEIRPRNLVAAAQIAIDEVRPLADRRQMTIRLVGEPVLEVDFNWEGMLQVFVNLLLNAIKYGQEGSEIEVRVLREQPFASVEVSNAGREISESERARIFDFFYRGKTSPMQQGMGIGLHVVKRIVEAHSGNVNAASEGGRTALRLSIPAGTKAVAHGLATLLLVASLLGASVGLTACASSSKMARFEEAPSGGRPVPEIALTPDDLKDPELEESLESIQSARVLVPTDRLREMVRENRRMNAKLEALKNIDKEEAARVR